MTGAALDTIVSVVLLIGVLGLGRLGRPRLGRGHRCPADNRRDYPMNAVCVRAVPFLRSDPWPDAGFIQLRMRYGIPAARLYVAVVHGSSAHPRALQSLFTSLGVGVICAFIAIALATSLAFALHRQRGAWIAGVRAPANLPLVRAPLTIGLSLPIFTPRRYCIGNSNTYARRRRWQVATASRDTAGWLDCGAAHRGKRKSNANRSPRKAQWVVLPWHTSVRAQKFAILRVAISPLIS